MTSFPPWFLVSPMKRTRTKWMHHVSWWNSIAFPTCVTRLCLYISNNRRSGRMPTTTTAKWLFPGLTLDPIRSCFWFGFWFEREFGQIFCYLVWGRRFRTECGGGMMMGGVENVFFFTVSLRPSRRLVAPGARPFLDAYVRKRQLLFTLFFPEFVVRIIYTSG